AVRANRSGVSPAGRSRSSDRRRVEGPQGPRLVADGEFRTVDRDDGGRRSGPVEPRDAVSHEGRALTIEGSVDLKERLRTRKATIGVIGLGYVGLPLAVEFAREGFDVTGFDVDSSKVTAINAGRSYIG